MSREIMQQALDAFEDLKKSVTRDGTVSENWDAYYGKEYHALEALRKAVEQAEKQEPQMIQIKDGHLSYIKKPWVGLTTEESSELYNKNYDKYDTDMTFMDFFMVQREVEAQLKEKNT